MGKCKVNYDEVNSGNALSLIEAVARYADQEIYADSKIILSILGIHKDVSDGDM